jgi:hypothetical protein
MRFEKHIHYFFNLLLVAVIVFGLFTTPIFIIPITFALIPVIFISLILLKILKIGKLKNRYGEIMLDELIRLLWRLLFISALIFIFYGKA